MWKAEHAAYGQTTPDEDPDVDGTKVTFNLRFPGQYYDAETGLHYNYFRYYDPDTGRYITEDPIGLLGGINLYVYVLNNPLIYQDYLGFMPVEGPGRTGNPITGPYRPPPSTSEKIINKLVEQAAKRIAKEFGIPPQLIGRPGVFSGVGLFLTPTELGCSSFDCNNNGIPDEEEKSEGNSGDNKGC